jgi:DUF4097 and DUF4098 domain-containing protein YvlB
LYGTPAAEAKDMNFPTRCLLTLAYAWCAVAFGATAPAPDSLDISKVLGSVRLASGQTADEVSTVNGSVTIEDSARANAVETVNGSVRIGARASVGSAESVNGDVTVEDGAEIRGNVETVNGSVELRPGSRVGGAVTNVNGDMVLEGATVAKGLSTVNADILLRDGTRIAGGIRVEDNNNGDGGWLGRHKDRRNPRITVEQGVTVEGPLRFEREVDLYLAPGVTLPDVQGVEPRRYAL